MKLRFILLLLILGSAFTGCNSNAPERAAKVFFEAYLKDNKPKATKRIKGVAIDSGIVQIDVSEYLAWLSKLPHAGEGLNKAVQEMADVCNAQLRQENYKGGELPQCLITQVDPVIRSGDTVGDPCVAVAGTSKTDSTAIVTVYIYECADKDIIGAYGGIRVKMRNTGDQWVLDGFDYDKPQPVSTPAPGK